MRWTVETTIQEQADARAHLALVKEPSPTESIEAFFARYEAAFNRALIETTDLDALSEAFADAFIAANPNGVACWRNDDNLLAIMKQGFEFYRSLGSKSARITSLCITRLDETHAVVKAGWEMLFARKSGELETIVDDVFYLVQTIGEEPRIFSFITPDERQLFRDRGLIRSA